MPGRRMTVGTWWILRHGGKEIRPRGRGIAGKDQAGHKKESQRGEVGIVSDDCQQIESKRSGVEKSGGVRGLDNKAKKETERKGGLDVRNGTTRDRESGTQHRGNMACPLALRHPSIYTHPFGSRRILRQ